MSTADEAPPPPPPPVIPPLQIPAPSGSTTVEYFTSVAATIFSGESTVLSWKVTGADAVTIEPGPGDVSPSGEIAVQPTETTTYTLRVKKGETVTKIMLTVGVTELDTNLPPPAEVLEPNIQLFSVLPSNRVFAGSKVSLHWDVQNATSVTIVPERGEPIQKTEFAGAHEFVVDATSWFVLRVQNGTKEKTASLTVLTQDTICLLQENCQSSKGVEEGIGYIYYGPFACLDPKGNPMMFVPDAINHRVSIYNSEDLARNRPSVFLGQPHGTSTAPNQGRDKPGLDTLYEPRAVWSNCKDKIVVADQLNHRVLLWDAMPTISGTAAHYVLGQPHGQTGLPNHGSAAVVTDGFERPSDIWYDENVSQLFVADTNHNRVMVYDNWPPNPSGADLSLNIRLSTPRGVSTWRDKLFIADSGNHRVLVYQRTGAEWAPQWVLGQVDLQGNQPGLAGNQFRDPQRVFVHAVGEPGAEDVQIWVSDDGNNRALRFSHCFNPEGQLTCTEADLALGADGLDQKGFFQKILEAKGMGGCTIGPIVSDTLYSCSYGKRILIFDNVSQWVAGQHNPVAEVVLGQPTEKTASSNFSVPVILKGEEQIPIANLPTSVFTDDRWTFVTDETNHRILLFQGVPKTTAQKADRVLGQVDLYGNLPNRGGEVSGESLDRPRSVYATPSHLFVSDSGNYRVLIWGRDESGLPTGDPIPLGQENFTTNHFYTNEEIAVMPTAERIGCAYVTPSGVFSDGTRLFVANPRHNRVLVWNTIPTRSLQPADIVLGQADCSSTSANHGKDWYNSTGQLPNAITLNRPQSVTSNGSYLLVSDWLNHRVLGYRTAELSDSAAASFVIGQPDFESMSAVGLNLPYQAAFWNQYVAVADYWNNRILFFDVPTETIGGAAREDLIFGQTRLDVNLQNQGKGTQEDTLFLPNNLFIYNDLLFITEYGNQRLLIRKLPTSSP